MKISYYPGCTLKTKAKNLENSAVASLALLGVELEEIPRWNCCGAVHSLSDDDLIHQVAPVRDLIRAKEQGHGTLVTLCSMCYNTLARANIIMRDDEEKRNTINLFMDEEEDYLGDVAVVHLLNFLRDDIGWENIREKVKNPLDGLKVAPYYGCTLQRPRNVGIEPTGRFELMSRFLEALGGTAVHFPAADLCCGSYQILGNPEAARSASSTIVEWARREGAEALVLSCPLCDFNLKRDLDPLPTFYFTQLMAVALGLSPAECSIDLNGEAALELLREKNMLPVSETFVTAENNPLGLILKPIVI